MELLSIDTMEVTSNSTAVTYTDQYSGNIHPPVQWGLTSASTVGTYICQYNDIPVQWVLTSTGTVGTYTLQYRFDTLPPFSGHSAATCPQSSDIVRSTVFRHCQVHSLQTLLGPQSSDIVRSTVFRHCQVHSLQTFSGPQSSDIVRSTVFRHFQVHSLQTLSGPQSSDIFRSTVFRHC
ncbi:hypothetical protein Btru_014664 [Bulinus truncatus]|nr:hypothetical protein Btru_014664 [Bulinus truncatus]